MVLKVLQKYSETKDTFSLIFKKPHDLNFYPGQYLDLELPVNDKFGNTRAFTISSSPTEEFLRVTTKKGISDFKKALEKLNPGDEIKTSHPAGTFILDETSPAVFIAGGIGITPFRSILKYVSDNNLNTKITLLYSNPSDDFLFKDELDTWVKEIKNLTIYYINTFNQNRLNQASLQKILNPKSLFIKYIFYLAGSHVFVDSLEKILLKLGVDKVNIRFDYFDGY